MRVNYESKVDWRMSTDLLRCAPQFHNALRNDCILYQTTDQAIFGRLLLIFTCSVGGIVWPIAMVEAFDAPLTSGRHLKRALQKLDKDLSFYRVRSKGNVELIPLQSLICGALLVPDWNRPSDYFVHDTVDADMFLRIREMRTT